MVATRKSSKMRQVTYLMVRNCILAKEDTAAGADGWKPYELKALPSNAWDYGVQLLRECVRQARHPTPYFTVSICAKRMPQRTRLGKKSETSPLDDLPQRQKTGEKQSRLI